MHALVAIIFSERATDDEPDARLTAERAPAGAHPPMARRSPVACLRRLASRDGGLEPRPDERLGAAVASSRRSALRGDHLTQRVHMQGSISRRWELSGHRARYIGGVVTGSADHTTRW